MLGNPTHLFEEKIREKKRGSGEIWGGVQRQVETERYIVLFGNTNEGRAAREGWRGPGNWGRPAVSCLMEKSACIRETISRSHSEGSSFSRQGNGRGTGGGSEASSATQAAWLEKRKAHR
eukprot:3343670-Rhodomonas_salina.4